MALSKTMQDALNAQMQREFYSSYLYLAMAGHFENISLSGFANWMNLQADEERMHAMKFYNFIVERGGEIELGQIDKPPRNWDSPLKAFEATLEHEEYITRNIHELVDLSLKEKDHAAHSFLQFFVDEQVEEEDSVNTILGKLRLVEKSGGGMFMLDNELGGRSASAADPAAN